MVFELMLDVSKAAAEHDASVRVMGAAVGSHTTPRNYVIGDAEIQEIHIYAENFGGPSEELSFEQVQGTPNGVIQLRNVGFDVYQNAARPLWEQKTDNMFVTVSLTAKLADGTTVTKRAFLGQNAAKGIEAQAFAPLYDAGDIPNAVRYSPVNPGSHHEVKNGVVLGYDAWGTADSFTFLQTHPALSFNDLSLEHAGPWPPEDHHSHDRGTSIDLRYLGGDNPEAPLNGSNVSERLDTWKKARLGDADALGTMITWIIDNRQRMDQLFDAGGVRLIYIEGVPWHWNPLVLGKFADGTDIEHPETHATIGPWAAHGVVDDKPPHLNHFHVERWERALPNKPQ
jgi:hypothetical protein